jgi:anti-anti-sigma regulatory factor
MLKITSEKNPNTVRLRLEGSLTGPWVGELEHEWRTIQPAGAVPLVVDLTNVTFVGEDGKLLLKQMWREGAQLIATGCCLRHLVEEITRSHPDMSSTRCGTK